MFDFKSQAVPAIRALKAYDPGHDIPALRMQFADATGLLELGSNESCYGHSARVQAALAAQMPLLNRYPDPSGKALKAAIAMQHGVDPNQILLGNGSHELLMQLAQVFAGPGDEVLVSRYCFAVYPIATQAAGANLVVVEPYASDASMPLGHDLAAMAAAITVRTKLVFFANPNNPTGTWFSLNALEAFMAKVPEHVLVVADEAYIEFATAPELDSALALRSRFPNLIIARTFSKAYGLAGLRAGYLIADASVVQAMEPVRESFNLNAFALAAAEAALADGAHIDAVCTRNASERQWLATGLAEIGISVLPSQTNFLLASFGEQTERVEAALFTRGIIVRPMGGYGLHDYLRITVSTRDENQRLLDALKDMRA
jgi:histidinol-phosphate aminotransferase